MECTVASCPAFSSSTAVAGVLLGLWLHKRAPEKLFFQFITIALLFVGCKLIWDGWTGLTG